MKSVVVEIKDGYAAVLSEDGGIQKIKNKGYLIGQVIEMKKQNIRISKKMAGCAAAVATLLVTGSIGAWAYNTPYTYVSLDVNPSIEYSVNRFDTVIDVTAVNDDGEAILDEINVDELENQPIEEAIASTVDQISENGYFDPAVVDANTGAVVDAQEETVTTTETQADTETTTETTVGTETTPGTETVAGTEVQTEVQADTTTDVVSGGGIIIATSSEDPDKADELAGELQEAVEEEAAANGDVVEVEAISVGLERVQEARELGVTPGKLNLVEKLKASAADPDSIDLEEWLHKPVRVIMKATKENRFAAKTNETTTEDTEEVVDAVTEDQATVEATTEAEVSEIEATEEDSQDTTSKKAAKAEAKVAKTEVKAAKKVEKTTEKASSKVAKTTEKASNNETKATEKAANNNNSVKEKQNNSKADATVVTDDNKTTDTTDKSNNNSEKESTSNNGNGKNK